MQNLEVGPIKDITVNDVPHSNLTTKSKQTQSNLQKSAGHYILCNTEKETFFWERIECTNCSRSVLCLGELTQ